MGVILFFAIKHEFGSEGYDLAREISEDDPRFNQKQFDTLWKSGKEWNEADCWQSIILGLLY